ncbi:MAG: metallophosphoesterase [Candidatus Woesearchaeota archaeon]
MKFKIQCNETCIIDERFKIQDTFLYDIKEKVLFIADTHIGLEEYYKQQGIFLPRIIFNDLKERVEKTINNLEIKTIILLGDIKHEFGTISKQEWIETISFFKMIKNYNLILIKGNHDTILKPITDKFNLQIYSEFSFEDVLCVHGDKELGKIDKNIKYIIIGHEHPAISLRKHGRVEKFKCFLLGKYKGKKLIVLPSAHNLTEGTDVLKEQLLSPLIHDLENFEVIIIEDKPYYFSKVKNLQKLMLELS